MSRPPYLRRAAAIAIVVTAVMIELRPTTTERIPIAVTDLPAGSTVTEADVTWLAAEAGLIDEVAFPTVLSRKVAAGTPISIADVDSGEAEIPPDWLLLELEVPLSAQNGATIVAVISPSTLGDPATGVVTHAPTASGFDTVTALVAFPPSEAVRLARAVSEGTVTVLLGR